MKVFAADLVHDEPEEAATDSFDLGYFPSLRSAVAAVVAGKSEYWQTGGVYPGELTPAVLGVSPEHFEQTDSSYFVGIDGRADR